MSNEKQQRMFGRRLKVLRKRQKLSLVKLGKIGNVALTSQVNYEKGLRSPDTKYLMALNEAGFDTHYLLTGKVESKNTESPKVDTEIQATCQEIYIDQNNLNAEALMTLLDSFISSENITARHEIAKVIQKDISALTDKAKAHFQLLQEGTIDE